MKKLLLFTSWLAWGISVHAQCEIKNRVSADGSMYYYIEPLQFFWTTGKQLTGGVMTDNEHYFLSLRPYPFPSKPGGNKLDGDLQITLSNQKTYNLHQYDVRYIQDTIFMLMYIIDEQYLQDFLQYEAETAEINMGDKAGPRVYRFKLHKSAIKAQLQCLMKKDE